MHGSRDHLVPLEQGIEHIEIFEQAGWDVTRLEHEKGHMVNLNQLDELILIVILHYLIISISSYYIIIF